jgi:rhamnosyltransferase
MTDPTSNALSASPPDGAAVQADAVLAVVVTYHPPPELADHLRAIRRQVGALVVVDNGSPDWQRTEALCADMGASFIRNLRNEGIARALNQGAEQAQAGGYRWLAMFDQDSSLPDGTITALVALAAHHPHAERVGIVATSFRDRHLGRSYHDPANTLVDGADWREVRTLITSGSLVCVDTFARVGGFDERLFIDFVDHEHCLRLRRAGWLLVQSKNIFLDHAIGRLSAHRFLGRTVHCSNHSPARRYYITRNQLEYYRRCLFHEPYQAFWGVSNLVMRSVLVVLYEEHRPAKARAILRGLWHFAIRRFGAL